MKKILLHTAFVLLGISAFMRASAQITIPASINDNQIDFFNNYGYPNSYTIDYSPFCTGSMACSGTNKQLTALVSDDGITPRLYVNDQTPPIGANWTSIGLAGPGGCAPDVVIGNDFLNVGWYIAGVVYVSGGNVMLDLYHVSGVGIGGGALTITGPYNTITVSGTGTAVPPAHIDLACSSANPYMGLPNANMLAITWKDNTGIMGYYNTLNAPGAGTSTLIAAGATLVSPDVAYVERAGAVDIAQFAYIDVNITPNKLFYSSWKTNPPSVLSAPILYDDTRIYYNPYPGTASMLRIDAIDDLTKNIPGGANATFCIAASAIPISSSASVLVYNDKTGPGVATDITTPVTLPAPGIANAKNQIPVIAAGPGKFYSVGYFSDPPSLSGGAQQMYYATSVNWTTGKPTTSPNAYAIMQQLYDPMYLPGLCLSGTCNTNTLGLQDLFAGYDNSAFLLYKYSLPVAPYAFKQAPKTPANIEASGEWQVYPNPATEQVSLIAPLEFNTAGATYDITDMNGKTLQGSTVNASAQEIKINNLPAGSYLFNIHSGSETKTIKFVK